MAHQITGSAEKAYQDKSGATQKPASESKAMDEPSKDITAVESGEQAQHAPIHPFSLSNLARLTALSGRTPDFFYVEACCFYMTGKGFLMVLLCALDWGMSFVLAGVGLALAQLYYSALDWTGNFDACLIYGVILGVVSAWNIAQYASYTIQTTGHLSLLQHFRSLRRVGPALMLCNLLGWILGYVVLHTPLVTWPMGVKVVIVAGPPIAAGIATKTTLKLRYFREHAERAVDGEPKDAFCKRLREEVSIFGEGYPKCPFQSIGCRVFSIHFAGPITCFLWTVVYTVGLSMARDAADKHLEPTSKTVVLIGLFLFSLLVMAIGMHLFDKWVRGSKGFFGYNHQMLVAIVIIYGLVSDVQVRLALVKMEGVPRFVCSIIQPAYLGLLRFRTVRAWVHENHSVGPKRLASEPWQIFLCMGTMVIQNVSAVLLAGLACIYEDVPGFNIGVCEHGLWLQVLMDSGITWLGDLVTIFNFVRLRMTALYFFSMLDPFLVVAAVIVTYMCTMLALLTASISV